MQSYKTIYLTTIVRLYNSSFTKFEEGGRSILIGNNQVTLSHRSATYYECFYGMNAGASCCLQTSTAQNPNVFALPR